MLVTPAVVALAAGAGAADDRGPPPAGRRGARDRRRGARAPAPTWAPAGIPDANGPGLRALVRDAGGVALDLGIAADRLEDVEARLRRGIAEADLVVVSGGVSVGPYDVVRLAFDTVGHVNLWRVAIQPGKPFAFGRADAPGRSAPVLLFGLPGNPVSSFVTFELFVRPVIRRLAGHARLHRPADRGVLEEPVTKSEGRRGYQRVVAAARRGRVAGPRRGRARPGPPRGRAGEPRAVGARRGRRARGHPRAARPRRGRPEVELRWLDGR